MTHMWEYAVENGVRQYLDHHWPPGDDISREEFDAVVKEVTKQMLGLLADALHVAVGERRQAHARP